MQIVHCTRDYRTSLLGDERPGKVGAKTISHRHDSTFMDAPHCVSLTPAAFSFQLDPDNTGFVCAETFAALVNNHELPLDPAKLEMLFALSQGNEEGQICYPQLVDLVSNTRGFHLLYKGDHIQIIPEMDPSTGPLRKNWDDHMVLPEGMIRILQLILKGLVQIVYK